MRSVTKVLLERPSALEDAAQLVLQRLIGPHQVRFDAPRTICENDVLEIKFTLDGRPLRFSFSPAYNCVVSGFFHDGTHITGVF